jgi:hypothetical protein
MVKTEFGNLMIIPPERRMVRVYVEASSTTATEYKDCEDHDLLMDAIRTKNPKPHMGHVQGGSRTITPYGLLLSILSWTIVNG